VYKKYLRLIYSEDFVKIYTQIVEELSLNISETKNKIEVEKEHFENYNRQFIANKNEILNEEGINQEKARLVLKDINIEFKRLELYPGVSIDFSFDGVVKQTSSQNSGYYWDDEINL
jgi:hypothetical protein